MSDQKTPLHSDSSEPKFSGEAEAVAGELPRGKTLSGAQAERQRHRERGKYAKVNPCYVCGLSAGVDYFSHRGTDDTIDDELLVLCRRCAAATCRMSGPEAVEWARRTHPETLQFMDSRR